MQRTARADMKMTSEMHWLCWGGSPATEFRQHLGKALIGVKTYVLKAKRMYCVKGMSTQNSNSIANLRYKWWCGGFFSPTYRKHNALATLFLQL
jgi:hypothetical protein